MLKHITCFLVDFRQDALQATRSFHHIAVHLGQIAAFDTSWVSYYDYLGNESNGVHAWLIIRVAENLPNFYVSSSSVLQINSNDLSGRHWVQIITFDEEKRRLDASTLNFFSFCSWS